MIKLSRLVYYISSLNFFQLLRFRDEFPSPFEDAGRHASFRSSIVSEKFSEIERKWFLNPSFSAENDSLKRSVIVDGGSGSI